MEDKYCQLTGCKADDATDIGIRLKVLAGELANLLKIGNNLEQQLFATTSTGDYLDRHGNLLGINRKTAGRAKGSVVFSRDTPATNNITIPKGVVVSTSTEPGIFFETTEISMLKIGEKQVEVPIQATELGDQSNLAANMISVIVNAPPGITQVTNPSPISGGEPIESDNIYRERILAAFQNPSTNANAAFYEKLAHENQLVSSAKAIPCSRGVGTVDLVVAVKNKDQLTNVINQLRVKIMPQREVCVDLEVLPAIENFVDITVEIQVEDGYTLNGVSAETTKVITQFISDLQVGESLKLVALGKEIFSVNGIKNYRFILPKEDVFCGPQGIITQREVTVKSWEA